MTPLLNTDVCQDSGFPVLNTDVCQDCVSPLLNTDICQDCGSPLLNTDICQGCDSPVLNTDVCQGYCFQLLNTDICQGCDFGSSKLITDVCQGCDFQLLNTDICQGCDCGFPKLITDVCQGCGFQPLNSPNGPMAWCQPKERKIRGLAPPPPFRLTWSSISSDLKVGTPMAALRRWPRVARLAWCQYSVTRCDSIFDLIDFLSQCRRTFNHSIRAVLDIHLSRCLVSNNKGQQQLPTIYLYGHTFFKRKSTTRPLPILCQQCPYILQCVLHSIFSIR